VLFTKFDALLAVAMSNLPSGDRQLAREEKVAKAQILIDGIFEKANIWGHLSQLKYAPKYNIRMAGMHNSNEGCNMLLETTARALNEKALQMLFVTAQEINITLCIKYAVQDIISVMDELHQSAFPVHSFNKIDPARLEKWFPHFWVR